MTFLKWLASFLWGLFTQGLKNEQQAQDQRDTATAGLAEVDKAQAARANSVARMRADPGSVRRPDADSAPRGSDGIS